MSEGQDGGEPGGASSTTGTSATGTVALSRNAAVEVWVEQATGLLWRATRPPLWVRRECTLWCARCLCRSSAASCRRERPSWPFHPDPSASFRLRVSASDSANQFYPPAASSGSSPKSSSPTTGASSTPRAVRAACSSRPPGSSPSTSGKLPLADLLPCSSEGWTATRRWLHDATGSTENPLVSMEAAAHLCNKSCRPRR